MANRDVKTGLTLSGNVLVSQSAGSAVAFAAKESADTYNRMEITQDGVIGWNSGAISYMAINLIPSPATLTLACDASIFDLSSGYIYCGNGSAATPAYAFGNDPDTGMFRGLSNTLQFSAGGSEFMRGTSAGLKVKSTGAFGTVESFRNGTITTADNLVNASFSASATTAKAVGIQGVASQSADNFYVQTSSGANLFSVGSAGAVSIAGSVTLADAADLIVNTTTGTKIATSTSQKIAFYNATPIVQPANTVAIDDNLVNLGLRASGGVNIFTRSVEINSTGALGTVEKFRVNTPTTADNTANSFLSANAAADRILVLQQAASQSASSLLITNSSATALFTFNGGTLTISNSGAIAGGTSTGFKICTSTSQLLAFWNKTPIVQPTTSITAATFVANTSGIVNDTATYGGYTMGKIAAALINVGILA